MTLVIALQVRKDGAVLRMDLAESVMILQVWRRSGFVAGGLRAGLLGLSTLAMMSLAVAQTAQPELLMPDGKTPVAKPATAAPTAPAGAPATTQAPTAPAAEPMTPPATAPAPDTTTPATAPPAVSPAPVVPASPAPAAPAPAAPATPATPATPAVPAMPDAAPPKSDITPLPDQSVADPATTPFEIKAKPVALLRGKAKWEDGYTTIHDGLKTITDAMAAEKIAVVGKPWAVFVETNDADFKYELMVQVEKVPEGKTGLTGDIVFGLSPAGKVLKFQHRGAYDDIDSTYEAITAYLDEKGFESKDLFAEEYLNDAKGSDDASLQVDVYVFLK